MEKSHNFTKGNLRVQFDLAPTRVQEIDELMAVAGLSSRKDLINNAVTLLQWAVEEVLAGREIVSLDREKESYEVLRMPVLSCAKRVAKLSKVPIKDIIQQQDKALKKEKTKPETHLAHT